MFRICKFSNNQHREKENNICLPAIKKFLLCFLLILLFIRSMVIVILRNIFMRVRRIVSVFVHTHSHRHTD